MNRWAQPILDVVGTIVIAFLLLAVFFTLLTGTASFGFPEGFRVLVNFMDVGLGIWVVLLIAFAVRRPLTLGKAFLFLVIGAVVNVLVVTSVGFIQTGGWATQLILYAIEAGVACIVAAAIVVPLAHRFVQKK